MRAVCKNKWCEMQGWCCDVFHNVTVVEKKDDKKKEKGGKK